MVTTFDPSQFIKNLGFTGLTAMQSESLSHFDSGKNVIISSPTGSGKTVAFLLMCLKVLPAKHKGTHALIITPTRELALQVTEVFRNMKTGLKVTTCYGGHKREIEENNLIDAPSLIVGTPGRIGDHIRRGNIMTEGINTLVLDEFDKSLELGFEEETKFIIDKLTTIHNRILTSATPLESLPAFLKTDEIEKLNFTSDQPPGRALSLSTYHIDEKDRCLFRTLCTIGNKRTIIFANEKDTVKRLSGFLTSHKIPAVSYHGSMEQKDREVSIAKFRNASVLFLVTTDLASRGLDIPNVRYIIHYDLPETEQAFIHRNGRTARMEASGDIIVMVSSANQLPSFIPAGIPEFSLDLTAETPDKTEWSTLYISAGKKDKINKIDIAGFLMQKAGMKKEDIGLIEVKDFYSFAAIRRPKMNWLIGQGKNQKIKNKKVIIDVAK
ncbi:MAG: DEAD/DEAH box helicase [Chitinophagaceae bacterium]|nr:DEAD/DEAH box helicase [Chitinophagaceae bacterium]